jgi:hypothetical protein
MNAPDQITKIIVSNSFAAPESTCPGGSPPLLIVLTIAGHIKASGTTMFPHDAGYPCALIISAQSIAILTAQLVERVRKRLLFGQKNETKADSSYFFR